VASLHGIALRPAVPSDAHAIARVLVNSWRQTHVGIVVQSYLDGLGLDKQTERWQKRLNDTRIVSTAVVAHEEDGSIVGFAAGGPIREVHDDFDGELYAIYVNRDVQGRGVGRRLLTEWARRMAAQGYQSAVVRVFTANEACSFYKRLGACRLREGSLELDGVAHAETWFGWNNLDLLTSARTRDTQLPLKAR
jgi:ribosomal protein S18 acetylase RimI-like enzyme